MIGYSYTYGNRQTLGASGVSEWLSELAQAGGTDLNPSGMSELLGEALIANDASLVCSGSGLSTGKVFYFIPNNYTRKLFNLINAGTDESTTHSQDVQRELVNDLLVNQSSLFTPLSVLGESEIFYY